jgi:hypothetical protein
MNTYQDVRPGRARSGGQRPSPVLPRGWAPLTAEEEKAVLDACDEAPDCAVFRLGMLGVVDTDYRVYCLPRAAWAGLWVATRCLDGGSRPTGSNRDLLGLGSDGPSAVRIALDRYNRDLEAHGEPWRLRVDVPAVPQEGLRRA